MKSGLTVDCRGDVFLSDDGGKNWIETHRHAFPPRYQHVAALVHGVLWVVGGVDTDLQRKNDAWRSTPDGGPLGLKWEQIIEAAPWHPRYDFAALVSDDCLYVFGGLNDRD